MTTSNNNLTKISSTLMAFAAALFLLYMGYHFGVWLKG